METLDHKEVINLLLQLASILILARVFAELARKFKQPAVVGEIFAGIILGPTILGNFFPGAHEYLFGAHEMTNIAFDGFVQISVVLLLFIAGLEVELHIVWSQGKKALYIAVASMVLPIIAGFVVAYAFPEFLGVNINDRIVASTFFGLAISITGLAIVARILMDLNLFKTSSGLLIIAGAMIVDVLGWLIFSVILSLSESGSEGLGVWPTIGLTLLFTLVMLTVGKGLINKVLPWINKKLAWPGGLLSLSLALCFLAASFTEFIGIHAIFGAFIIGVALGDSEYLTEKAKEILHQFINNIFAPIFFVSIGLKVNFISGFDPGIVGVVIVVGLLTKYYGAYFGGRLAGIPRKESIVAGIGMSTRGSMDIVLGLIALENGLVTEPLFIGLVILAIIASMSAGPLIGWARNLKV
ncbi:Kef-type K+ transport system, membrane component KefB [Algoriphagus locisalis]|uniref:Kef-type K+ transport system, membrane component KefB n=1 Tax=Algoriphagus locisalis TaxID=305507 RepID=A0A1I7CVY3_9BACT|nr:cation:proton antiporter [Algoriphagus locisalis]SFU03549.1 Kef-type K+ transport system, membrane component KefB [Algoriphagus locisalis]